ncbi:MAG: methylisocitrate lyase, partial [Burkholderiaceae bacterium]|nr:methylisocitrate lyase [Burkholderiaceae bacterium]
ITEFGSTPLFTVEELKTADVGLVLYPLSAFRAMNKAAENVYGAIRRDGTQKNVVDTMQTRMELYERIDYHKFEQKLDALFAQQKSK